MIYFWNNWLKIEVDISIAEGILGEAADNQVEHTLEVVKRIPEEDIHPVEDIHQVEDIVDMELADRKLVVVAEHNLDRSAEVEEDMLASHMACLRVSLQ